MLASPTLATRAVAAIVAAGSLATAALALAAPAAAGTPHQPHDPTGSTRSVRAVQGGLVARGWAGDVDAGGANVRVFAIEDGQDVTAAVTTSIAMPRVSATHPTSTTPGFSLTVPVSRGRHTVCIGVRNVGRGVDKIMTCVATPLGTRLSSSELAAHSPQGLFGRASSSSTTARFRGWAYDPDDVRRRATVVLYLDGQSVATFATQRYAGARPDGMPSGSRIDVRIPVSSGAHEACLWVVDVGLGSNTLLGCKAIDTRSHQPISNAAPAAITPRVAREGQRHIGQPYVWGATGPKKFDCSGLVMFSYARFGYATPRVARDQFAAARLIPASAAQPGDLVFYHDNTGNVYHVGIYLSPGRTVAAMDPADGIGYQNIWNPDSATYGSFSHS